MRLGFHHHIPINAKADGLYIIGHMGRFLDGLAQVCDSLILFMHESKAGEEETQDYRLIGKNISWVSMGPHRSAPYRTVFGRQYRSIIQEHINQIDLLLLRGPSPLLPALARLDRILPVALLIGGDYSAGVDTLPQPFWRKELIRIWAKYYTDQQIKAARRSLTFVNSHKLYDEMKPCVPDLFEIKTTTLLESDYYIRQDTCQSTPIHLLFTGRMARDKGLLDLVEAVAILTQQGKEVVLDLVGPEEKGDPTLSQVVTRTRDLGGLNHVVYHGYRPVGPELFKFYKQADIYLLASQSSFEGFPRTIWEAMAHCLPVIATSVGSIPDFLKNEDDAIIIPPKNPSAIATAVNLLLSEGALRRRIIQNGYALARENQIEKRSREMIQIMQDWLRKTK